MTLQQLRYVMEVASCGSITAAATKLFVSQPSLSKAISDLEQEMGIIIFKRMFSGSQLTDDGVRFVTYARQVVDDADRLEASYKNSLGPHPSLSVAAAQNALVSRAFGEVANSLGPQYEFSLRGGEVSEITERVQTRQSDVGVLYRSPSNADAVEAFVGSAGLGYSPLASIPIFAVLDVRHPLAKRETVCLEELANLPLIDQRPWYGDRIHPVRRLFHLPPMARRVIVSDAEARRNLISQLNGYGIAVGSLGNEPFPTNLTRVLLEDLGDVEICQLTNPNYPLSPTAKVFLSALRRIALESVGGHEPGE